MTDTITRQLTDNEIAVEVKRQLGRKHDIQKIHVSAVRGGDTVFHEGKVRTVSMKDMSYDFFMGHKLFGDSYNIGRKPVHRIVMQRGI